MKCCATACGLAASLLAALVLAPRSEAGGLESWRSVPPDRDPGHNSAQTRVQQDDEQKFVSNGAREATDLNVTLIERTPRYNYDAAKNRPEPGDLVTFHGHIKNWGSDALAAVDYRWQIDDVTVATSTLANLAGGEERVVTQQWVWVAGDHRVKLTVDPADLISELSESNNAIEDHTDAIGAGFWVEQSVYDYFHQHQHELGIGSNSWEDWAQRQMAKQNELYEDATWPNSPQGVLTRVRVDKIEVVPDGALPLHGGLPTNNPDRTDKTVDLMWGFPSSLLEGGMYDNHTSLSLNNAFFIEKSLLHELGHARYLIDCYGFDVHNTSSHHSVQIWEGDVYVAGSDYMPFIAFGEVLYYNINGGVMSGPYGFQWSPYEAGALNLIADQRACCGYGVDNYGGNQNAPANIGVYLQDLPDNNHIQFTDADGGLRVNATVRIYQAEGAPGWYGKTFDNNHDAEYVTDADAYIHLPRNPFNPGGSLTHTYGKADGVMILRIQHIEQIWYRFVEATDFNLQYWEGNTEHAYYTIPLDGPNDDSDADGLDDDWEMLHFGNLLHDGTQDEEPDGLTNLQEYDLGTNPLDSDSDDDGLSDGAEVATYETDPADPDTDGDGLNDGTEVGMGTSPTDVDSDDDEMNDGWEADHSLDPLADDAGEDPDNDGYTNLEEFIADTDPMKPWSIPLPTPLGAALSFDGLDDFADLGDVSVSGALLTVEAWVRPLTSGSARILDKLQDYGIQFTSGNVVRFVTKHGFTWDYLDGQIASPVDQWVHVACVLDGSNKAIYINGQPDTQKDYDHDVQVTANSLIVGANSPGATQGHIDAAIDDVRVWSVARSETEIQSFMNTTLSGSEPGLVGYWNFDDGSGQVAGDSAGSHDGRLGSSTDSDDADPTWVVSEVAVPPASGEGPTISDADFPSRVGFGVTATVTASITDAAHGDDGVASTRLYYGYDWPFNDNFASGSGPGGSGYGTWVFEVPAQGAVHQGDQLKLFLRADDGLGYSTFDSNDEALYAITIGLPGDADGDGDVDLTDYAEFAVCLNGPDAGAVESGCSVFDVDLDADVDLADFAGLQGAFNAGE